MSKIIFLISLFLLPLIVQAHPVSFQGSKGIMGYHSPILSHNQFNYSISSRFAAGVHTFRRPGVKGSDSQYLTANFLVKRWNSPSLQANIYALGGLGNGNLTGQPEASAISAVQFDIEDRDYYFLAKHLGLWNRNRDELRQSLVRVGFTPYVENSGGIHSWLILEWKENRFADTSATLVTPFLRVFYRNLLFEIGQSLDGQSRFNYITHF